MIFTTILGSFLVSPLKEQRKSGNGGGEMGEFKTGKKKTAGGGVEHQEAYIFLNLKIPIFTVTF